MTLILDKTILNRTIGGDEDDITTEIDYDEVFKLLGLEDNIIEIIDEKIDDNVVYSKYEIEQILYNTLPDSQKYVIDYILELLDNRIESTNLNLIYKKTHNTPYLYPIIYKEKSKDLKTTDEIPNDEVENIVNNYKNDRESRSYIEYNNNLHNKLYPKVNIDVGYKYKLENISIKPKTYTLIDKIKIQHYTFKDVYYLDCITSDNIKYNNNERSSFEIINKYSNIRFKGPTTINSYKREKIIDVDESQQKRLRLSNFLRTMTLGTEINTDYNFKYNIPYLNNYYNFPKEQIIIDGDTINIIGFVLLPYNKRSIIDFNENENTYKVMSTNQILTGEDTEYEKDIVDKYDKNIFYVWYLPNKKITEIELNKFVQEIIPDPIHILNSYSKQKYYNTTIIKNILKQFYYKQGYPPVDKKNNNIKINRCINNRVEIKLLKSFITKYPILQQKLPEYNVIERINILNEDLYKNNLLKEIYKIENPNDLQNIIKLKKIDNAMLYYAKISNRSEEVINELKNIILSVGIDNTKINNKIIEDKKEEKDVPDNYKFVMFIKETVDREMLNKLYKLNFITYKSQQYYVENMWVGCDHELEKIDISIKKFGKEKTTGIYCKYCGNFISDLPFSIETGFDSEGHLTYSAIDELLIKPLDRENGYIYKTILQVINLLGLYEFTETDITFIYDFVNENINKYNKTTYKEESIDDTFKKLLYMISLIFAAILWFVKVYNITVTAYKLSLFKGYNIKTDKPIVYFIQLFLKEFTGLTSYFFNDSGVNKKKYITILNNKESRKKINRLLGLYIQYNYYYISNGTVKLFDYVKTLTPKKSENTILMSKSENINIFKLILEENKLNLNEGTNYFEKLEYYYKLFRNLGNNYNFELQDNLVKIRNGMENDVKNNNTWEVYDTRYKNKNKIKTMVSTYIFENINTGNNVLDKEFSKHKLTTLLDADIKNIIDYTIKYNKFKLDNKNSIKYSNWVNKSYDNITLQDNQEIDKRDKFMIFCFKKDNYHLGKKHYFSDDRCIYCRYTKQRINELINSSDFDIDLEYELLSNAIRDVSKVNVIKKDALNILNDTELNKNELLTLIDELKKNINDIIPELIDDDIDIINLFKLTNINTEIQEYIDNKAKLYTYPSNNIYDNKKYVDFVNINDINKINLLNTMRSNSLTNLKNIIKKFIIWFYKLKFTEVINIENSFKFKLLYNDNKFRTDDRKYIYSKELNLGPKDKQLILHEADDMKFKIEHDLYNFEILHIKKILEKHFSEIQYIKPFEDITLNDDMNIQKIYNFNNTNIKINSIDVDNKCNNDKKYKINSNMISKSEIKYLQLVYIFLNQINDLLINHNIKYHEFVKDFIKEYFVYIKRVLNNTDITERKLYEYNMKKEKIDVDITEEQIQNTESNGYNVEEEENDGDVYGNIEDGEPVEND